MIPGASAVTSALMSSGMPSSSFTFKGFVPRKPGPRRRFLEMEAESLHTLIFFESPRRLASFLADAAEVLGDRPAAVCVELTKMFEEIHRDRLKKLAQSFAEKTIKGEVTIVVAGRSRKRSSDDKREPQETRE